MRRRLDRFNMRVAEFVTRLTSNIWFFWAALAFIVLLRVTYPPKPQELLLNVENDLQLLLLSTTAVVQGVQDARQKRLLHDMHVLIQAVAQSLDNQADTMEALLKTVQADLDASRKAAEAAEAMAERLEDSEVC